jgi:hypothetical protein
MLLASRIDVPAGSCIAKPGLLLPFSTCGEALWAVAESSHDGEAFAVLLLLLLLLSEQTIITPAYNPAVLLL